MKKQILNLSAIKKQLNKKALLFNYTDNNRVIAWGENGYFALYVPAMYFDEEIKTKLPTTQTDIPKCINDVLNGFNGDISHLYNTDLSICFPNKIEVNIYKNNDYNYLTPINKEMTNIINNIDTYTVKQYKQNWAVLFQNNDINIILLPCKNDGIAKKLKYISEGIEK